MDKQKPEVFAKIGSIVRRGGETKELLISFTSNRSYRVFKNSSDNIIVETTETTRVRFNAGALIEDRMQQNEVLDCDGIYRYLMGAELI